MSTSGTSGRGPTPGDGAFTAAIAASPMRPAVDLVVERLGRMAYEPAFELQRERHARVLDDRAAPEACGPGAAAAEGPRRMHLLLVEHDPPVITLSRRKGIDAHLVATAPQLAAAGVTTAATDRGGDITYHGPGQLVAYPIVDLNVFGLRLHPYMRLLEQVVIDVLATVGISGRRDDEATGVWVDRDGVAGGAKICAMGVRVSRWITMHGLALNVTTNLDHFRLIVPCGLEGRPVTSIAAELERRGAPADAVPAHAEVERRLAEALAARLGEASPAG